MPPIPSLRHYKLIAQGQPLAEVASPDPDGAWRSVLLRGLDAALRLEAPNIEIGSVRCSRASASRRRRPRRRRRRCPAAGRLGSARPGSRPADPKVVFDDPK